MSRNLQYCDRCLPQVFSDVIGYIPLPEMTNIGDTRVDERRILLCIYHYFEAKKDCYYVVPFNRDDDPKDDFLARVAKRHKFIRGSNRLKFNRDSKDRSDDDLGPPILDIKPSQVVRNSRKKNKKAKIHFREDNRITCGVPIASVDSTTEVEFTTCQNCFAILNRDALEQEPITV